MRLFAALELPAPVSGALAGWARGLARPGLRVLAPEALHVTLAFLGSRPDEEAVAIGEAVVACAAPVPGLRAAGPDWLGRGGVLAVDLHDDAGACAALQRAVSDALVALGAFTPEERVFRPHVTVARVRRGAKVDRRLPEPPVLAPFAGAALTLFASRLSPAGASYDPLARAELPG